MKQQKDTLLDKGGVEVVQDDKRLKESVKEDLAAKALLLAMEYHEGQVDKAGMPYIDHCLRVGILAGLRGKTPEEIRILLAIGFLHDILEDTEMTEEVLRSLIENEEVIDNVVLLTRLKGQAYFDYIEDISQKRYATLVKLADIEDHLEFENGFVLPESLAQRYKMARIQLLRSKECLRHYTDKILDSIE